MDQTAKKTTPEIIMRQAVQLARRGAGWVKTNPLVGAVLVYRGQIIATGYHARFGGPHAERRAVQSALQRYPKRIVQHATLYVTLEPCTHDGKTPACTPWLIAQGIKEVIIGSRDPNPLEHGRSVRWLRRAGLQVTSGVAQTDCDYLIRCYQKWITTKMPFVLGKVGMSIDGKISAPKHQRYISNPAALYRVHQLRQEFDSLIVGVNTIVHDNPRLTTRLSLHRLSHPIKIILDSYLRTPLSSQAIDEHTVMVCRETASRQRKTAFIKKGADILELPVDPTGGRLLTGYMDMQRLLQELGRRNITSVIIEGGANVFTTFINNQAIDEFYIFMAPAIYGATRLPFTYALDQVVQLTSVQVEQLDDNILVRGYAHYSSYSIS
ncbi:MAG: bifunctional diaminohydroxyphosphoribosylaminopyrimidine deaminase/5-amino-6-(5-phosphoribosylamino)uracil reductase RibD [Candidatus Kerfeldbacteria bacterium]|nr:bifunctional diaminohydroxyphosphoribosylaminopyrimidine deaminase/5-amino-6-(5-phosphoribosylamino)uracil reductase RibD [Candidatus Kerfeldbacteria bacterium]